MRLLLPLLTCLLSLHLAVEAAGAGRGVRKRAKCKYFKKGEITECDPVTQSKSVTLYLKKGIDCEPTQVFHQPCAQELDGDEDSGSKDLGCQYDRQAEWTECGPGVLSKKKAMKLKPGQPSLCPPTRTKTVPCKSRKGKSNKGEARKDPSKSGKERTKVQGKVCKYTKGAWSECDPNTNTRTRQLELKKGNSSVCLPRKQITKKCKKPCKYTKGPWQPCNEASNEKVRQLTLKKGDPSVCDANVTITKSCRRHNAFTAAKTSQCKYQPMPWEECDANTNTMTRILKLKSGDPALCQETKQLARKCRKPCKFSKGQWTTCDQALNLRTRTDRLIKGDPAKCEKSRVISRKCGQDEECKYDLGDWGECNSITKERVRVKILLTGPETCTKQVNISRPCFKLNGENNCFLGKWGDYGPCQNGVMMKHRPVIAGGVQCERKAVKAKPCS